MKKLKAGRRQTIFSFRFKPFIKRSLGCTGALMCSALLGCSTGEHSRGGLQFSEGITEEPQIQRAIARFCDSAYIAVNQSQEMSQGEVISRYQELQSQRKKWSSGLQVAELTTASLVSNQSAKQIMRILIEMEGHLPDSVKAEHVAELAKLSAVTEWEPSVVARQYRDFSKARKWTSPSTAIELTKIGVFTEKKSQQILSIYDELKLRQGRTATERELTELTKVTALLGKTPNDVVKTFDLVTGSTRAKLSRVRTAELAKIALLTGAAPKSVVSRYHDLMARRQLKLTDDRAIELTKISLLGKRSVDDVSSAYRSMQSLEGLAQNSDQMNAMTFSLLSGELLQDSVYGEHVDECNGAYARLFLSIDGFRNGEG